MCSIANLGKKKVLISPYVQEENRSLVSRSIRSSLSRRVGVGPKGHLTSAPIPGYNLAASLWHLLSQPEGTEDQLTRHGAGPPASCVQSPLPGQPPVLMRRVSSLQETQLDSGCQAKSGSSW